MDDHDRKIGARKQRTNINKYCLVNRTTELWNKLTAEALTTLCYKSLIFRRRVKSVIISEGKWSVLKGDDETSKGVRKWITGCAVMWSEVQWSGVEIFCGMCVLSSIYSYMAVCMFCAVRCVIIIGFYLLLSILGVKAADAWGWQPHHLHVPNVMKFWSLNLLEPSGPHRACYGNPLLLPHICYFLVTQPMFFNNIFVCFCFVCLFPVLCIRCVCTVLCIVFPSVYSYLFPIFVKILPTATTGWKSNCHY
jgi:hypothetical protein